MAALTLVRVFFSKPAKELRAGETAIAQIRFEAPVFIFAGDRFVIRDASEQSTLAGGVVLDPDAKRAKFSERSPARISLQAGARRPHDAGSLCCDGDRARSRGERQRAARKIIVQRGRDRCSRLSVRM